MIRGRLGPSGSESAASTTCPEPSPIVEAGRWHPRCFLELVFKKSSAAHHRGIRRQVWKRLKSMHRGGTLVLQWLRLCAPNAGGTGFDP